MFENAMLIHVRVSSYGFELDSGRSLHPMLSLEVILKDPESTHVSESSSNGSAIRGTRLEPMS